MTDEAPAARAHSQRVEAHMDEPESVVVNLLIQSVVYKLLLGGRGIVSMKMTGKVLETFLFIYLLVCFLWSREVRTVGPCGSPMAPWSARRRICICETVSSCFVIQFTFFTVRAQHFYCFGVWQRIPVLSFIAMYSSQKETDCNISIYTLSFLYESVFNRKYH